MQEKQVTIKDLEALIEQSLPKSLGGLPKEFQFPGYRPQVRLVDRKTDRKKRQNASAGNWSPDSGEIRIRFELEAVTSPASAVPVAAPGLVKAEPMSFEKPSDELQDLIRSLDQAESRPGYDFVALKWFRDAVLPAARPAWTNDPEARNRVLRDAIEKRFVLTSKVPNPKSPTFPVTAVRLNRSLPEIRAILGASQGLESEFRPAAIRGEPLSATVLRERR
ncbi:MAG: hypothetical protein ABSB88_22815 [Bryobacteraceae bacterium]|jgi:hypothetical protein